MIQLRTKCTERKREVQHLGQINIEEERLLGVRDLDSVLPLRIGDIDVVHSLDDLFHCGQFRRITRRNPQNPSPSSHDLPNSVLFSPPPDLTSSIMPSWGQSHFAQGTKAAACSLPIGPTFCITPYQARSDKWASEKLLGPHATSKPISE